MNCFECAKANDAVPAVGVCQHCGVGLCLDHLIEAQYHRLAWHHYACATQIPSMKPLRGVPAGIAAAAGITPPGVA